MFSRGIGVNNPRVNRNVETTVPRPGMTKQHVTLRLDLTNHYQFLITCSPPNSVVKP